MVSELSIEIIVKLTRETCEGAEGDFRRVGLVRWMKKSWFEGMKPTTVTIV